jgi:DNA end-binding protein Ku
MARAIWKGAISFGLVNIPVELYPPRTRNRSSSRCSTSATSRPSATSATARSRSKEVEWANIVKGYEYEKDQYVVLSDEDFSAPT